MRLSEPEHDAIIELFNLGMGRAASALGQMVDAEVVLSVPSLDIVRRSDASEQLGCPVGERICAVRQTFAGPFDGQAMLIFPEGSSLELVRRLMPDSPPLGDMTDLEEEALTEVGNVILNHCLASFANLLHAEIRTEIPVYQIGRPEEIIGSAHGATVDSYVLIIRVDFGLFAKLIEGHVLFLQDIASIQALQAAVRDFLSSMDS
jgi:chemotaxis protein CheC